MGPFHEVVRTVEAALFDARTERDEVSRHVKELQERHQELDRVCNRLARLNDLLREYLGMHSTEEIPF